MMFRWISSVPPAMLDEKEPITVVCSAAARSSAGSQAWLAGPAISLAISRKRHEMTEP